MERIYYFAYNLHMDSRALTRLNVPVHSQSTAVLKGYRLVFNVLEDEKFRFEKRGIANIAPSPRGRVEGIAFEINEEDLDKLDLASGVRALKYYRKKITVIRPGCSTIEAVTYAGWPDVTSLGLLPSGKYLRRLIEAATRAEISRPFKHWLQSHPTTI